MKAIQTEKLTKYYGKTRGILDVNLSVEEGEFFGFIGPNGAGKSTTIRTLLGLLTPTSGSAQIFGLDVEKETTNILEDIGYLPSEAMFYQGMKVKEILEFSANLRHKDCTKEANVLCERLDLDPSRKVSELSLGNRKKVGIICALQHFPKLYILDEPIAGVDPAARDYVIQTIISNYNPEATVLISTHLIADIEQILDEVVFIKDGKIVLHKTLDDIRDESGKSVDDLFREVFRW